MRTFYSPPNRNPATSNGVLKNDTASSKTIFLSQTPPNKQLLKIKSQQSLLYQNNQQQIPVGKVGYLPNNGVRRVFITEQSQNIMKKQSNNQNLYQGQQKACTYENQDQYIGEWAEDKISGQQKPHGYGVYKFVKDKLQYRGYFKNGVMHGTGTLQKILQKSKPQIIYEGEWLDGQKHGQGKYYYDDRTFYEGTWNKNKKQGQGLFQSSIGSYDGFWLNDKKHGKGVLRFNNGTVYDGQWQNDQFIKGQVKYSNGDQYNGTLNNYQRDGVGQYIPVNQQQIYKGNWKNNKKHGDAQISYQNGEKYIGQVINDMREGIDCVYQWKNGVKIIGVFENNLPVRGRMIQPGYRAFEFDMRLAKSR